MLNNAFIRHAALGDQPERRPKSARRIAIESRRHDRREQRGVRQRA